jgi:hypothetical protein
MFPVKLAESYRNVILLEFVDCFLF